RSEAQGLPFAVTGQQGRCLVMPAPFKDERQEPSRGVAAVPGRIPSKGLKGRTVLAGEKLPGFFQKIERREALVHKKLSPFLEGDPAPNLRRGETRRWRMVCRSVGMALALVNRSRFHELRVGHFSEGDQPSPPERREAARSHDLPG